MTQAGQLIVRASRTRRGTGRVGLEGPLRCLSQRRGLDLMKKFAIVLAALIVTAVFWPQQAEARCWWNGYRTVCNHYRPYWYGYRYRYYRPYYYGGYYAPYYYRPYVCTPWPLCWG